MVNKLQNPIEMAIIGGAHGTKGEVRVKSFSSDPMALKKYHIVYNKEGAPFKINTIRMQKNMLVVQFADVTSRDSAEALKGTSLYIDRSQLMNDLEEDEFYQTDLIGLVAHDSDNNIIGTISAFFNFGAGDLLELRREGYKPILIPFSKAAVPLVSIDEGFMIIDPYAAGLLDTENTDDNNETIPHDL